MSIDENNPRAWKGRDGKSDSNYGEGHRNSVLTEAEVRDIKSRPGTVRNTAIAREFGLHPSTVRKIRAGLSWSHVKADQ